MERNMRRRWLIGVALAMIATLAISSSVSAGGWATVEIDKPVTLGEVGEKLRIEFTLLQHGDTPTDWTTTYFEATNTNTGETFRVDAQPGTDTGRWGVDITFPTAGTWEWAIKTDELQVEGEFPALTVLSDGTAAGNVNGITPSQLDAAILQATEPLTKQVASISGEMDVLRKQVMNLSAERDSLQKQVANLGSIQSDQTGQGIASPWVAAIVGALSALIVAGVGTFIAFRRGLVQRPELAGASA